ncbi:hypothetical protein HDV00_011730 [Rhizophlyctis rosea]|nr:hypothetical protein HDV00_011730 [Rhizophlyctis rosea]
MDGIIKNFTNYLKANVKLTPIDPPPFYAQPYPNTCRNITLIRQANEFPHLWLKAECLRTDGTYCTSFIDLNVCIGPQQGPPLKALTGYITHELVKEELFKDVALVEDGKILTCTYQGEAQRFNLTHYLYNHDGCLEFWCPKGDDDLPNWVKVFAGAAGDDWEEEMEAPNPFEVITNNIKDVTGWQTPLDKWEDEFEEKSEKWYVGTRLEGDKVIRRGNVLDKKKWELTSEGLKYKGPA